MLQWARHTIQMTIYNYYDDYGNGNNSNNHSHADDEQTSKSR